MKKKAPDKDNAERYLLSYADLMNLLLILFIILYSMSKTDVAKATAVAEAIRKGFNAVSSTSQTDQSPTSANTSSTAVGGMGDYSGFYDKLIELINEAGMQSQVDVTATNSNVVITLKDTALYASGSATMNQQVLNLMTEIGRLITQVQYGLVMVEGYTDNDPIHTQQFTDNLDLSTARANGVNRVFQAAGIPSAKVDSVGHGENYPVAKNDTLEHKAMNRRVVITILKNQNGLTAQEIIAAQDLLSQQGFKTGTSSSAVASSSSSSSKASSSSKTSSSKTSSSKSSSSKPSSSKSSSSKTSSK